MVSEPPLPKPKHDTFGRGWTSAVRLPESRTEMTPDDPDRLMAEREARRGLRPPPATIRRVG